MEKEGMPVGWGVNGKDAEKGDGETGRRVGELIGLTGLIELIKEQRDERSGA
jgi:hypothetical protein